ncbi:hypothetical protein [Echinicola sp. 20G]|uniref:hypothetical protein n=1 Tax=Echinicola sp. 20G TaxID=2781961 RepID=UPI0019102FC8|nr:hypothetical protein [Echinicola sp. 20G]
MKIKSVSAVLFYVLLWVFLPGIYSGQAEWSLKEISLLEESVQWNAKAYQACHGQVSSYNFYFKQPSIEFTDNDFKGLSHFFYGIPRNFYLFDGSTELWENGFQKPIEGAFVSTMIIFPFHYFW